MTRSISLDDLKLQAPVLTDALANSYRESCIVCFDHHNHTSGVNLDVVFIDQQEDTGVHWVGEVTDHIRQAHVDLEKRVDGGACAVALMLVPEFTDLAALQSSAKGNGIDYYLGNPEEAHLIFNNSAVLEVSGIQTETSSNSVSRRIRDKKKRLLEYKDSPTAKTVDLPTFICVVEFSQPKARVEMA